MEFKSSNPVFGARAFTGSEKYEEAMTLQGTINKAYILFGLLLATAIPTYMWANDLSAANAGGVYVAMIGSLIAGFVVSLILIFANKKYASVLGPIYALIEGVFIGSISGVFNFMYEGIVFQAIVLTLGVFFCMLGIYKTGIIQPTEKFKSGMAAGFMALLLFMLGRMVFGLVTGGPLFVYGGLMSIGISVVIVVFAALTLILDFDEIETGANRGAPKYMEWYSAFGLMVTIVWIYLEILNLLAKLRNR